ncbi:MAG: hypothetical protein EXR71_10705 [Myxococcales bacterium]|nr:hypothetical protein [Myxococcales bacterium]
MADAIALRAAEIHKTAGVPLEVARLVALGRLDLNEAVKKMAFVDEVSGLMARHGLDRALATQVALGHARLEPVLAKRRIDAHLDANRGRDVFVSAVASQAEQVLGLYGRRLVRAVVLSDNTYEIVVRDAESGAVSTVHKTAVKFVADASSWPKARKAMTWDPLRKARELQPILAPQKRFGCSNRRLGEVWDKQAEATITLVEGEVFEGTVAWVARWELGLHTKGGDIAVLRHALDDFRD